MGTITLVHDSDAVMAFELELRDEIITANLEGRAVTSESGKYTVLAVLGRGASSVVCQARDAHLDRPVALKLFPVQADDASSRAVKREARNLARVRHQHVVVVHEIGDLVLIPGDHRCSFVAMDLGKPLLRWMEESRPSQEELLTTYCQIGEGLAAIHERNFVHRDFKPGNVVLVDDIPKIVDFGLAVSTDAEVDPSRPPRVVGTPPYMAPEVLRGRTQDARSDQFSFAAALWQALVGEFPYDPQDLDPDARQVTRMPRVVGLAAPVDRALRQALQPTPEHRFDDMRALVAALQVVDEPARASSTAGEAPAMELDAYQTTAIAPARPPKRRWALGLTFPFVGALSIGAVLWTSGFWVLDADVGEMGEVDPEPEPEPAPEPEPPEPPPSPSVCPDPEALVGTWTFSAAADWAENSSLVGKVGRYSLDLSRGGTPCGLVADLQKHGNDKLHYAEVRRDRQSVEVAPAPGLSGGFAGRFVPKRAGGTADLTYNFSFVVDGDQLFGDFRATADPGAQRFSGVLWGGRAGGDKSRGEGSRERGRLPCVALCGAHCLGVEAIAACRRGCTEDAWSEALCPAPDPSEKVSLPSRTPACTDARRLAGHWIILARDRETPRHRAYEVDLRVDGCDLVVTSARERGGELLSGKGRAHATGLWELTLASGRGQRDRVIHAWSLVGRDPAFGEFTAKHGDKAVAAGVLAAYRRP